MVSFQILCYCVAGNRCLQGGRNCFSAEAHLFQFVVIDFNFDISAFFHPVKTCHGDIGICLHLVSHLEGVLFDQGIRWSRDSEHDGIGGRGTQRNRTRVTYNIWQIVGNHFFDFFFQILSFFQVFSNYDNLGIVVTWLDRFQNENKSGRAFADIRSNSFYSFVIFN